ncbi:hypothetical protein [Natrarchaeobius oligotrophus]|uniref:Uncharacterized protein n=1 Tax=Natrarchaeobius chitinivorans TaxID=1679083 RepID=A0A3N6LWI7_NATCH|nr:hypothetical protein [Natrarchaeobius chitinivorans]RQG95018.1 hypothetical protein EA472_22000 [Natrarchaeobius chitinivorans]
MLESRPPDPDVTNRQLARAGLVGGVGLPVLVAVIFVLLPDSAVIPWWQHFDVGLWLAFVLLFAFAGALLGIAWRVRCSVAVGLGLVALVGAVVWPILGFGEPPTVVFALGATAFVVVPLLVLAVPTEYLLRSPERNPPLPTRLEVVALLAGIGHLLAVHGLQTVLERRPLLPGSAELVRAEPTGLLVLAVIVMGLILLAAVPIVLATRVGLVSPVAIVLVAFGWATYRTWLLSLETLPPDGPGFGLLPTPLTLYAWGASVLLVVVVLAGGLEYLLCRPLGIGPPGRWRYSSAGPPEE